MSGFGLLLSGLVGGAGEGLAVEGQLEAKERMQDAKLANMQAIADLRNEGAMERLSTRLGLTGVGGSSSGSRGSGLIGSAIGSDEARAAVLAKSGFNSEDEYRAAVEAQKSGDWSGFGGAVEGAGMEVGGIKTSGYGQPAPERIAKLKEKVINATDYAIRVSNPKAWNELNEGDQRASQVEIARAAGRGTLPTDKAGELAAIAGGKQPAIYATDDGGMTPNESANQQRASLTAQRQIAKDIVAQDKVINNLAAQDEDKAAARSLKSQLTSDLAQEKEVFKSLRGITMKNPSSGAARLSAGLVRDPRRK